MGIIKFILSFVPLLLVILAALYFSRCLDPRDILKPVLRMNSH